MKCKQCNTNFKIPAHNKKQKFCSKSCSATYNNTRRRKTHIECKNCGDNIQVYPNQIQSRKFCSSKCSGEYRSRKIKEQHTELIEQNKAVSTSIDSNNAIYRKYLINKHGASCNRCGWSELNPYTNKVPIEMHHIDGDCNNTNLENLELLCPNCHSLTPTHKGANANKGNSHRYKVWKDYFKK